MINIKLYIHAGLNISFLLLLFIKRRR